MNVVLCTYEKEEEESEGDDDDFANYHTLDIRGRLVSLISLHAASSCRDISIKFACLIA